MINAEKANSDTEAYQKLNIEKLIREATEEGNRFCDFSKSKLKEADIQELKDLGFRVEERMKEIMFQDFHYFRVLW